MNKLKGVIYLATNKAKKNMIEDKDLDWSSVWLRRTGTKCPKCGTKIATAKRLWGKTLHLRDKQLHPNVFANRKEGDFVEMGVFDCPRCNNTFGATLKILMEEEYPDPKDMTDKELIGWSVYFDEYPEPGCLNDFARYFMSCIEAEIERRGITDKQIEDAYGK